ncbi:Receptor-interacting serine/threonine-protein kinase 4 [Branchiostoma belcheri]|nr:Receptor-interacting serine/threonine-protein kinase 4 [Branchiostoma belcheri]
MAQCKNRRPSFRQAEHVAVPELSPCSSHTFRRNKVVKRVINEQAEYDDVSETIINERDLVKLDVTMETLTTLQGGHGGFTDEMEQAIGEVGVVTEVDDDEDVHVYFSKIDKKWIFNPAALQKVGKASPAIFKDGDLVLIGNNLERIKTLQDGHGEWNDAMEECTAAGAECALKDKPLRPPGSPCGCDREGGGCADCGICRTCAEESSDDSSDDDIELNLEKLGEAFGKGLGAALSLLQLGQEGGRAEALHPLLLAAMLGQDDDDDGDEEARKHGMEKGDEVKVEIDAETFRTLQEKSGWHDEMLKVIGIPGTVIGVWGGTVSVKFVNGARWTLVPECLTKVTQGGQKEREAIKKSDLVKLIKDEEILKELQKDHGGYNDEMQACLGKTGCVVKIQNRQVKVDYAGRRWWFNRAALTRNTKYLGEQETPHQIKEGDYVKVDVDPETFKDNQHGHGGFVEKMKELVDEVGIVHHIDIDGDAVVYYPNSTRWCINPMNLGKVSPEECGDVDISGVLQVGDWVKVDADKDKIKRIQEMTVKWDEGYYKTAGMVGRVKVTFPFNEFVRVRVKGAVYPLNLTLVKKATPSDLKEAFGSGNVKSPNFARGDLVKINVTLGELKSLQEGHGGYVDRMDKVIGLTGCVSFIDSDGDIHVRFTPTRLCFNPAALTKVKPTEDTFHVGDVVLIEADKTRFISLQTPEEHGGYNEKMAWTCGKTGRLIGVIDSKKVRVKIHGKTWVYNPDLVTRMGNPGLGTRPDFRHRKIPSDFPVHCEQKPNKVDVKLKLCAGEGAVEEEDSDDEDKLKELLGAGLGGILGEAFRRAVKEHVSTEEPHPPPDDHSPNEALTDDERKKHIYAALSSMHQTIELMRKSKGPDSIDAVKDALEKNFLKTYSLYDRRDERKLMGDHLANIDAAQTFKDYLTLLSSEVAKSGSADKKLPLGCLEVMRRLLISYTDNSAEFCRAMGHCGLIGMLVKELVRFQDAEALESDENLRDIIQSLMIILYNCARVPETKDYFIEAGAIDRLKACLRADNMDVKLTTLCCLAYVIDADELHLIRANIAVAEKIMSLLNAAINDPQHSTSTESRDHKYTYSAMELVTTMGALARNDDNKHAFIKRGAIGMLIKLIEGNDENEKVCAVSCIQRFALCDAIREAVKTDSRVQEVLKVMSEHESRQVRAAAEETLHLLEHGPKVAQDTKSGPASFSEVDYSDLIESQLLGHGAFGKVYKAKHRVWMMDVAVKKLALRLSSNDSLRKQLFDEASFMHRARHNCIVPLYGVCIDQNSTALVMDYMENGSVEALMAEVRDLPWALRWRILHETALGMNFLHSLDPRIIHHDLKAQNILLDEDFHAKITDFGLSEWKQHSVLDVVDELSSSLAGTITHIPPEHFAQMHLRAGKEFDVYSFGVVIWEVLTGQTPFQYAMNTAHIRNAVTHGQRPDKKLIPKKGPQELSFFIDLMEDSWHQEPAERPAFRDIAEQMEPVIRQTRAKVVEAVQTVLKALGKDAEKVPQHHSAKWAASMRQEPGISDEQQTEMENSGKQGIIQSFKKK